MKSKDTDFSEDDFTLKMIEIMRVIQAVVFLFLLYVTLFRSLTLIG